MALKVVELQLVGLGELAYHTLQSLDLGQKFSLDAPMCSACNTHQLVAYVLLSAFASIQFRRELSIWALGRYSCGRGELSEKLIDVRRRFDDVVEDRALMLYFWLFLMFRFGACSRGDALAVCCRLFGIKMLRSVCHC